MRKSSLFKIHRLEKDKVRGITTIYGTAKATLAQSFFKTQIAEFLTDEEFKSIAPNLPKSTNFSVVLDVAKNEIIKNI